MAITSQQVKVYMSHRESGQTRVIAAASAGMSQRTARRLERRSGEAAKGDGSRSWRTRDDPFAAVWSSERVPQLESSPVLQALTLLESLQERYPESYPDALLRTLQRRVKDWRARYGPDKEVMFLQHHGPGVRGLSDFTQLKGVVVRIAGVVKEHLDPRDVTGRRRISEHRHAPRQSSSRLGSSIPISTSTSTGATTVPRASSTPTARTIRGWSGSSR